MIDVPSRCAKCPLLNDCVAILGNAEASGEKILESGPVLMERDKAFSDLVDHLGSIMGDQALAETVERLNQSLQKDRQRLEGSLRYSDEFINDMQKTIEQLIAQCEDGPQIERRYRLFGNRTFTCNSHMDIHPEAARKEGIKKSYDN